MFCELGKHCYLLKTLTFVDLQKIASAYRKCQPTGIPAYRNISLQKFQPTEIPAYRKCQPTENASLQKHQPTETPAYRNVSLQKISAYRNTSLQECQPTENISLWKMLAYRKCQPTEMCQSTEKCICLQKNPSAYRNLPAYKKKHRPTEMVCKKISELYRLVSTLNTIHGIPFNLY